MAGYAGRIALVNLTSRRVEFTPTDAYADAFLGGRGLAARLYWEQAAPDRSALSPENPLVFATGPLAGFVGLAASRCQVCAKSPTIAPERFSYASMGGSWGPYLKLAGCDAIAITGWAETPSYLLFADGGCQIRDASHLWGKGAIATREALKAELGGAARVVAIGPAGENGVSFATLLADDHASAAAGMGAVMGSKNLKAIVATGGGRLAAADPDRLRALADRLRRLKRPTAGQAPAVPPGMTARRKACYGCIVGCVRSQLATDDGKQGKYLCQNSIFYEERAKRFYGESNRVPFDAYWLCDDYGLDTLVVEATIGWLADCHRAGLLAEDGSGLPLSRIGSLEFIEALVRQTALRHGFGRILAEGTWRAAAMLGRDSQSLLRDQVYTDGTTSATCPRVYLTTALMYATEPRRPLPQTAEVSGLVWRWLDWRNGVPGSRISSDVFRAIAERYWGSAAAADLTTYDGKALAAKLIQDRWYAKESLALCSFSWATADIEHFEPDIVADIAAAVTGRPLTPPELNRIGERVFNLQRAILLREGHQDELPGFWYQMPVETAYLNPDCLAPDGALQPTSRRGEVIDRGQFDAMRREYYHLRGWDDAGVPSAGKLGELGLGDVAAALARRGVTER